MLDQANPSYLSHINSTTESQHQIDQHSVHTMMPMMQCVYGAPYTYLGEKSGAVYTDRNSSIFETPSPSRHSSDGSSNTSTNAADCCQNSPTTMFIQPSNTAYQLNRYWHDKVMPNKLAIQERVEEVVAIVTSLLKQVEIQEPRFTCSLHKTTSSRYDGFIVEGPTEFHVLLYLNHMAVFNYIDDGSPPGCAALKLSDGRKRSMSLWVEFITASGYLSARKIRAKFSSILTQVLEKNSFGNNCIRLIEASNDIILLVNEVYKVHISPAFSWKETWPGSIGNWVLERQLPWPSAQVAGEAMLDGVTLVSRESIYLKDKQSSLEGDAWQILYTDAEERLIYSYGSGRKRVLSVLKCLRDHHLTMSSGAVITNYHLKTLVLYESEKHPCDSEWEECCYADRIQSVLLQLIACLQSGQCQHYLQPGVDLFRGSNRQSMLTTAKAAWSLVRVLIINEYAFGQL